MEKNLSLKELLKIQKRYKVVCNNSINGGDCHQETTCETFPKKCLENHKKYFWCKKCMLCVCNHCYENCLGCKEKI